MREKITVACPRCDQPIEVIYTYDPGTREIPPSEDADFSHKCGGADDTEFTDAEQQTFDTRVLEALVAKADERAAADDEAVEQMGEAQATLEQLACDTPADLEDTRGQYPFAGDV